MVKLTDILKEILLEDRCKRIADRKFDNHLLINQVLLFAVVKEIFGKN